MNAKAIIETFKRQYPEKNIICLPDDNPTEIICEVDPSSEHPNHNRAIAAIRISKPHYHRLAEETYKVLAGRLKLFVDDRKIELAEGETYVVPPNSVHYAKGNFTVVQVDSTPGWTPEDHILVTD